MTEIKLVALVSACDSVEDDIFSSPEINFHWLDVSSQRTIINKIKDALLGSVADKEALNIAKYLSYKIGNVYEDNASFDVSFNFLINGDLEAISAVRKDLFELLNKYGASVESMDFITNEVYNSNKKLKAIMDAYKEKNGNVSWRDLNRFVIRDILEIYNSSNIDLRTKKIVKVGSVS